MGAKLSARTHGNLLAGCSGRLHRN